MWPVRGFHWLKSILAVSVRGFHWLKSILAVTFNVCAFLAGTVSGL